MTSSFSHLPDDQLLGLCIDREARGEPEAGRIAVGSVVLNRVKFGTEHKAWGIRYGYSIPTVILAPFQFSWTIASELDPNYLGARGIARDFHEALARSFEEDMVLWTCCEIADGLISGAIKPNTSALYYKKIGTPAAWAKDKKPMMVVGHHGFYA